MAAPRKPQDHLPKTAEPIFGFTGVDGQEHYLPEFSVENAGLTGGDLRKNRNDEQELVFLVLEKLVPDDAMAALDALPLKRYEEVLVKWQEASGVSVPQS